MRRFLPLAGFLPFAILALSQTPTTTSLKPHDPGVRGGTAGAGQAFAGLDSDTVGYFNAGRSDFMEEDHVADGLGPRYNAVSCAQCHAQPDIGGSSPPINPQVADANFDGAQNSVPFFITASGPVREARFPSDGGVHNLYVIAGAVGTPSTCAISQEDFPAASSNHNLIFRIPTPIFGWGLIDAIPDRVIVNNLMDNSSIKRSLGIRGRVNRSGNDGTVTRFGWKAQNKSLVIFAGEAYNVEQGITNEDFPTEREERCPVSAQPEDHTNFAAGTTTDVQGDVEKFAIFMRFLDQPKPISPTASTSHGLSVFKSIGCQGCHTPSLSTGHSAFPVLSGIQANLYSDLALHHMGSGLADRISQGLAQGDEFRTAPLWGIGQRIFSFTMVGRRTSSRQSKPTRAQPVPDFPPLRPTPSSEDIMRFPSRPSRTCSTSCEAYDRYIQSANSWRS